MAETYLEIAGERYDLPGDAVFTIGSAWETRERRTYDGTKTAQSIAILPRYGRQPTTYQLSFTLSRPTDGGDLWPALADYESIVGRPAELFYSGYPFGDVVVVDGSFSMTTDGATGLARLVVSYNLRESVVVSAQAATNVHTIGE